MELGELWKKLDSDKLSKPVLGAVHIQKKSKHPVEKLKQSYLISTVFSMIFLAAFVVLFFLFHEWVVRLGLAVTIISYVLFFYFNYNMYRSIKTEVLFDTNLLSALKDTYAFISNNIRFQEKFALFVYPFAGAAGMLMGLAVGGGSAEKYLNEWVVVVLLVVVPLLLTPPCYFLAKWMYKVSYGKCLIELKERIDELERPN